MTSRRKSADAEDDARPGIGRLGTRLLELAENVVYAGIAAFLVGTALVCLVLAGRTTWRLASDFSEQRAIAHILGTNSGPVIHAEDWERGRYCPTPTIIEAAMALYGGHGVAEISRSDAGAMNLSQTSDAVSKIIASSR